MAEILDLLFAQPAFQKRAGINAGRSVTLEVNEIAGLIAVAGVEEMIEADFEQRGQRRIGRDVAADAGIFLVLPMHHGHRVPADQALDAPLQLAIAGIRNFLLHRNGVDVGRVQLDRDFDARLAGPLISASSRSHPRCGPSLHHLVEGLQPFGDFLFGINLPVRRKLEYSIIDFVCGHRYLNNFENS